MPGVTARPTRRDIVVVNLHYSADPEAFTPEVLARERRRHGCTTEHDGSWKASWKWQKEMELDWTAQSGRPVFENEWLAVQRTHLGEPLYRMGLDENDELVRMDDGPVLVFIDPRDQPVSLPGEIETIERSFAIGMDIGAGVGESDSTIEVFAVAGREQAAEFGSNTIQPAELGRLAVKVAKYFNNALICPVNKLHGVTTLRAMVDAGYSYIWRSKKQLTVAETPVNRLGWGGGESSDENLFGKWIDAIQHAETILRSVRCLDQHQQYLYDDLGRITLASLSSAPMEIRKRHGDYVVACALAYRACIDSPLFKKPVAKEPDPTSYAYRARERQRVRERERQW